LQFLDAISSSSVRVHYVIQWVKVALVSLTEHAYSAMVA